MVDKLSQLKVRTTLKQGTVDKLSQLKVSTTLKEETVDKLSQLRLRTTLKRNGRQVVPAKGKDHTETRNGR